MRTETKQMLAMIVGAALVVVPLALATASPNCPNEFVIGMTYQQIKSGPCRDIGAQAIMLGDDPNTVVYYCPSRQTAVVGDVTTGKMVGFFLLDDR